MQALMVNFGKVLVCNELNLLAADVESTLRRKDPARQSFGQISLVLNHSLLKPPVYARGFQAPQSLNQNYTLTQRLLLLRQVIPGIN
jgi:hypothetical protein